jgi:hypothetical protein
MIEVFSEKFPTGFLGKWVVGDVLHNSNKLSGEEDII